MVSVRKRKMSRSSVKKNTRRVKDKRLDINIASNAIIAANWDKSLTLQQNYKRLGLRAKLGTRAGGEEREVLTFTQIKAKRDGKVRITPADVEQTEDPEKIPEGEARIIRNDANEVVKVIYGTMQVVESEAEDDDSPDIISQLEAEAEKNSQIKKEALPSVREGDWLKDLHEKYGDDYDKMKWDKKLNPMQQSAGDLKKRIAKWKRLGALELK